MVFPEYISIVGLPVLIFAFLDYFDTGLSPKQSSIPVELITYKSRRPCNDDIGIFKLP